MNLVNYPKDEGHKVLNQANDKEKGYELFVPWWRGDDMKALSKSRLALRSVHGKILAWLKIITLMT
jgi:hypothetical protein